MRRRLTWLVPVAAAIVVALLRAGGVQATPASGFAGTTLARGRFDAFEVFNHDVLGSAAGSRRHGRAWVSLQKTKGASDLYVQTNVWQPGGSTGWHTHPGHSLIIVTAGEVTAYEGDDPECTPHVYSQGMGFVDHGGDHVHVIRNEGAVEARTVAVQLIPADATRRLDAPDPGHCSF
jgi:hypothetical protein